MSDFITLTCPNCSGRLQITDDINRFACMYCGVEHVVRRGGGIITLQPVVDELKKVNTGISGVKVGVDRTASELAIQRLQSELNELTRKRQELETVLNSLKPNEKPSVAGLVVLMIKSAALWFILLILVASTVAAATENSLIICISVLVVPSFFTFFYFRARREEQTGLSQQKRSHVNQLLHQLDLVEEETRRAQQELARHRQLVRSIDN